jgi:alpha-beta hydrolase superfamily lysophospholipase
MFGRHPWLKGLITSTSIVGLTATSGLVFLANHLIDEFSQPHGPLEELELDWLLPHIGTEPPRFLQRPLTFNASDGTLLCGDFWAQTHAAPTIVLCHGYRVSRDHLRPVATIMYNLGYNLLLFDFRGHGDSDDVITTGGNAEVRDLEAALVAANVQPETIPHKIIIHGFSMGAAIPLLMPPHPEVVAIIADSPYSRSDEILRRLVEYRLMMQSVTWKQPLRQIQKLFPFIAWIIIAISMVLFKFRFGQTFVARPDKAFRRWFRRAKKLQQPIHTPIMLIHASGDELIPIAHSRRLATAAQKLGIPLETYFVNSPSHCGASVYDLAQYTYVIQNFVSRYLGDDFPKH